jgi:O-methyltransferase involved in polyketide biosynthesis
MMTDTSKIKATNLGPCYARSFSDIPLSRELSKAVGADRAYQLFWKGVSPVEIVATMMEARHKAIDVLVKRSDIKQIVELAAGWTPRGMTMTEDPDVNYVETDQDLAEIEQKKAIARKLLGKERPNLHTVRFNAVTGEGLEEVKKCLKPGPVCVIHEGLFRYLSHDLKAKTVRIIHDLIEEHGGVYITPDVHVQVENADYNQLTNMKKVNEVHSRMTGTDIEKNHFKSNAEAKRFFEKLGFKAEIYTWGELVPELSCMKNPALNPKILSSAWESNKRRTIWELTLK